MDIYERFMEISSRLEHLENSAEWIARETVHADQCVSQTGTMICVIAEDIREKLSEVIKEIDRLNEHQNMN